MYGVAEFGLQNVITMHTLRKYGLKSDSIHNFFHNHPKICNEIVYNYTTTFKTFGSSRRPAFATYGFKSHH